MAAQTATVQTDAAMTSEEILSWLFPDIVVRSVRVITEAQDADVIEVDVPAR